MNEQRQIHDLASLEREIFRLRCEARDKEKKIRENLDNLGKNVASLFINSLFCNRSSSAGPAKTAGHSFFKNEKLNTIISHISDRVADRASEGIENFMDRIFRKREHHTNR